MKKTLFTALRAMCVGAMTLFAVSCYDDSALNSKVEELDKRLTEVEQKLNDDVAALTSLVSRVDSLAAKVAAVKVETSKDGVTTLTLSDGTELTVSANGVITIVEEDGVQYWGVVEEDGTVKNLGVEVGHKELVFTVDAETSELLLNGAGTGVFVPTDAAYILGDIKEGDATVTLTIGDAEFEFMLADSSASLVLGATKFFLHYEGTRAVELVAEGIAEYYVMSKPDGWRAFMLDETTLWVIAPTYKQLAAEAAEEEGEILVHGTTAEGKCKVAKIEVTTGPGLTLELRKGGEVFITNSYAAEEYNMWGDYMGFNFTNFFVGFATDVASFKEDPTTYLSTYETYYAFPNSDPNAMFYNNYNMEFKPYEAGVYEKDELTANIAELYAWMTYEELPYGSTHIFWICAADDEGMPDPRTVEYVEYSHFKVNAEVTKVTHADATVTLDLAGADKYYVGLTDAWFEANGMTLEFYMEQSSPWSYLVNGYAEYIEDMSVVDGEHTINLSEIYAKQLAFGTKYYFWVIPYVEGTVYNDYASQFEPYVFEVTTKDITAGGTYEVTFSNLVSKWDSVSADVALSEGTGAVYYDWFTEEEYLAFESDADLVKALFGSFESPLTENETLTKGYRNPGETWYLATVSVGTDGAYGTPAVQKLQTLTIPHDDAISVELESLTLADKKYTAVLKVTGATKVVGYNLTDNADSRDYNISTIENNIAKSLGIYISYQWVDVVDGKATVTFNESTSKKDYFVWGYNVTAEGELNALQAKPLIFNLAANLPAAE